MVAGRYEAVFPRNPYLCPVQGKSIPLGKIKYEMYGFLAAGNDVLIFFRFSS